MRMINESCIQSRYSKLIGFCALVLGVLMPIQSIAEVSEFSLPGEHIEPIRVNGMDIFRVRIPIESISHQMDTAFHYNICLELPVSCRGLGLCEVNLFACESPFTALPDTLDWEFSQNVILSGDSRRRIQLDIKQILIEAIEAEFMSLDVLVGQLREEPLGESKTWLPSEGAEPWKIIVSSIER